MIRNFVLLTLALSLTGLAASPKTRKHAAVENEDLQFIFDWQKDQRSKDLADSLALTEVQADQLRTIRGEVDAVKAAYEPAHTALKAELEAQAKAIRDKLEAGGTFDDEDRANLEDIHQRARNVRREERLKIGLAVVGLGDVLTTEQKRILYRTPLRHDGAGEMGKLDNPEFSDEGSEAPEGRRRSGQRGDRRHHGRFGKNEGFGRDNAGRHSLKKIRLARILLSDSFLKNLG